MRAASPTLCLLLLLTACSGKPSDRLSDEDAAAAAVGPEAENLAAEADQADLASAAAPLPEVAQAGPIIYRAVGTEPGWNLIIRSGRIDYIGDYGEMRIAEPTPAGFKTGPGTWRSGRLQLSISQGPCNDGMSDLVYRDTVSLIADGKPVSGCGGGTVAPDSLDGTRWSIVAVNSQPTGGGASYYLAFEGGSLSAKFGCNSIGGPYSQNGDHLAATGLDQTLVGCPDPSSQFETQGLAILGSNMRVERLSGTRLRLVSEAGSLDLRRVI